MDCGMKCIKFLVFIFNLLFALSGLIILIVGAVIQAGYREYLEFVPHEIFSAPMILIAVGVVIFVIAFFGCCGAMKENNCMVLTFAVLLGIIFIMEISAGIAAYVMRSELEGRISERMTESMRNYKWEEGTDNIVTSSWNVVQHELHCCGVNSFADWKNYTDTTKTGYPPTCCAELPQGQKCEKVTYEEGCLKKLSDHIKSNVSIIGGVGIGIAFVQLIGIVFACCLSKSIRRDYETV